MQCQAHRRAFLLSYPHAHLKQLNLLVYRPVALIKKPLKPTLMLTTTHWQRSMMLVASLSQYLEPWTQAALKTKMKTRSWKIWMTLMTTVWYSLPCPSYFNSAITFSNLFEVSDKCACVSGSKNRSQSKIWRKENPEIRCQVMECKSQSFPFYLCMSLSAFLQVFLKDALAAGKIRDDIVDEHALLLFIDFCAGRCKWNRRGEYIPNTRIGAVRITLLIFFEFV